VTPLIDRILEGRSFARAARHPSGLPYATRLVPPNHGAHGYEDAYALNRDLLVTTKNLAFERGFEEVEPGWGRLVLCVHLQGYRVIEVQGIGRHELKAPAFVAFYQAPGVRKRSMWPAGGKEISVMTGFAPEHPPVPAMHGQSLSVNLTRDLHLGSRPFLWLAAPLDSQMEMAARALIAPAVHDALLQPYLEVKAQELVYLGLSKLLPEASVGNRGRAWLPRVCRMIGEDAGNPLSLATLAYSVGLSPRELRTQFRAACGVSLPEYVVTVRMTRARMLLEETEHGIKEIAFRSGYQHLSNFCTAYKRYFGVTPREARRRGRRA